MIKAKPAKWANFIFDLYVSRLLNKSFNSFRFLNECPDTNPDLPLLLVPNHSSWWDGFFIYLLNKKLFNRQMYIMMLESQLSRLMFFRKLGAFSINPEHKNEIRKSLRYTLDLMRETRKPASLITIFPQGELLPWSKRPLHFRKGIEWIISHFPGELNLLPVAIRIEFLMEQRADVYFKFGVNRVYNSTSFTGVANLETSFTHLLDSIENDINNGVEGHYLNRGKSSINKRIQNMFP